MNTMFGQMVRNFLRAALAPALSLAGFCAWAAPTTPWTVVDEQNRPVAGASVDCHKTVNTADPSWFSEPNNTQLEEHSLTDAKGQFKLTNSANSIITVVVQKAGFSPVWVLFPKAVWNTSEPLILAKPTVLEGTVFTPDHRPASDAQVWAYTVHPNNWSEIRRSDNDLSGQTARELFSAKTDKAGHFRIENFPPESTASLGVTMAGFFQETARHSFSSLDFHSGQTNIELTLETAGIVEGKVIDRRSGQPVAGVTVQFGNYSRSGRSSSSTTDTGAMTLSSIMSPTKLFKSITSGPDGLFSVTEVAPGTNYPQISFTGAQADIWTDVGTNNPVTVVAGKTVSNVCVYVIKSGVAEVSVISTNDLKPIANASVYSSGIGLPIQTDSNGVARLRTRPGTYTVSISKPGWSNIDEAVRIKPGQTNVIKVIASPSDKAQLVRSAFFSPSSFPDTIKGTVCDASGAPAPGILVSFHPGGYPDAPYHSETITDTKGKYELPICRPLNQMVFWNGPITPTNMIMARDLSRNLAAASEFVEFPTTLDLTLQPGISFSGTVRDLAGAPIINAYVYLRIGMGNSLSPLTPNPIQVDAQGSFTYTALPQGRTYDLDHVIAKGYAESGRWVSESLTHTNHYVFTNLVLKPANFRLSGIVKAPDGKPLAGTAVNLSGESLRMARRTQSDDQGHFAFDSLSAGALQLSAYRNDPNHTEKQIKASINVDAGQTNVILQMEEVVQQLHSTGQLPSR